MVQKQNLKVVIKFYYLNLRMKKSIFTNKKDIKILIKAGKKAAKEAIQENIDLGLKSSFEKNRNSLIKSNLKIKKGTILYVKSK